MGKARYIGEDFRGAVDWTQDQLHITRPVAEQTVWSAIHARAIIWRDGVYLLEDDDEMETRKKAAVRTGQKSYNAARKWTRLHFRNTKRTGGKMTASAQRALNSSTAPPDPPALASERGDKAPSRQPLPDPALPLLSTFTESAVPSSLMRHWMRLHAGLSREEDVDALS
jgi:hypothetical protein